MSSIDYHNYNQVAQDNLIHFVGHEQSYGEKISDFINRPLYWLVGTREVAVRSYPKDRWDFELKGAVPFDWWTLAACIVDVVAFPLWLLSLPYQAVVTDTFKAIWQQELSVRGQELTELQAERRRIAEEEAQKQANENFTIGPIDFDFATPLDVATMVGTTLVGAGSQLAQNFMYNVTHPWQPFQNLWNRVPVRLQHEIVMQGADFIMKEGFKAAAIAGGIDPLEVSTIRSADKVVNDALKKR